MKKTIALKTAVPATLASLLTANNADAIIQYFTTSFNAGLGNPTTVGWDVDQLGGDETSWTPITAGGNTTGMRLDNGASFSVLVTTGSNVPGLNTTYEVNGTRSFRLTPVVLALGGSLTNTAGGFTAGQGFIGFTFTPGGSGFERFGWAEVAFNLDIPAGVTVIRWAYEDSGQPITVGAIPEPATVTAGLGALALGAAGLRRWRKRKAA